MRTRSLAIALCLPLSLVGCPGGEAVPPTDAEAVEELRRADLRLSDSTDDPEAFQEHPDSANVEEPEILRPQYDLVDDDPRTADIQVVEAHDTTADLETCQPQCQGLQCGPDSCGGDCGQCPRNMVCADDQICSPLCTGPECGGECCGNAQVCYQDKCCTPTCKEAWCLPASDGCGGECDPKVCDDDNPCTDDFCAEGACAVLKVPGCCVDDADCVADNPCAKGKCVDGTCQQQPPDDCCQSAANCDDGDVCTKEFCLENQCYNVAIPIDDCCNDDSECDDTKPCTDDVCGPDNLCTNEFNDGPQCCHTNEECLPGGKWADDDPETLDYCWAFSCIHSKNSLFCDGTDLYPCEDDDPCTFDVCEYPACKHEVIAGCCVDDGECSDADSCTLDECVNNVCVNTKAVPTECSSSNDCDDCTICTDDVCIAGKCKYIQTPDCCNNDGECDDDNGCTIDACVNMKCVYEVDMDNEELECCATNNACVPQDGSYPCHDHLCVSYECVHNVIVPCQCSVVNQWLDCDDMNPCTCDLCIFDLCRNLGPEWGIVGCGLPDYCCATEEDCETDNPCTDGVCTWGACTGETVPDDTNECDDGDPTTANICLAGYCVVLMP